DGFEVMPMINAAPIADIMITATGNKDILRKEHMEVLKDGCVLGNSGHFDNEISKVALESLAGAPMRVRDMIDQYTFLDGRIAYLIAEGRLMNLAAGQGHPVEIMDMSFAIQALSLEYLVKNHKNMKPKVYDVPSELDQQVARTKLKVMDVHIDELTPEQIEYMEGWQEGT
ncbi:MAG: adenosylhomocysteinase, partial [Euryarchaeota archaeon]|nr:adenosylhomocysteinase [Euryarchaeota archaeon]